MSRTINRNACGRLRLFCRCHLVIGLWLILGTAAGWLRESSSFRCLPSIPANAARATASMLVSGAMGPSGSSSFSSSSLQSSPSSPLSEQEMQQQQEQQLLLEVEEKFSFSNRSKLEERLRQEGFEPVQEITMVDWYFDRWMMDSGNGDRGDDTGSRSDSSGSELPLVKNDHWLRFRQVTSQNGIDCDEDGEWQLKRGTLAGKDSDGGGATVYEEIEGLRAVEIACSLLSEESGTESTGTDESPLDAPVLYEGNSIPELPIPGCSLQPFARIVTQRSKWKQQQQQQQEQTDSGATNTTAFLNLVVDLDTTPDGFAVGEVEALVDVSGTDEESISDGAETDSIRSDRDEAVAQARADIRRLLDRILDHERTGDGDPERKRRPPMGKLEQFLYRNQPRIHNVCVESGVIPAPPTNEASA